MAVAAVFFDVGETLVDEERWWWVLCRQAGLQPHVVWAALASLSSAERSTTPSGATLGSIGPTAGGMASPTCSPALAAVHVRRGPWGRLQEAPGGVPVIDSLADLPAALASLA